MVLCYYMFLLLLLVPVVVLGSTGTTPPSPVNSPSQARGGGLSTTSPTTTITSTSVNDVTSTTTADIWDWYDPKEPPCKFVIVTGGVISGIGKGVTASSVGLLLKMMHFRPTAIKIDPYLNVDAVSLLSCVQGARIGGKRI